MFFSLKKKKGNSKAESDQNKNPNFLTKDGVKVLESITEEFGLDFINQEHIAIEKIKKFALKNSIYDYDTLVNMIKRDGEFKTKLINSLTIGETYFYREVGQLKVLVDLLKEKEIKNILCAPCSSGEEVYSILLFLQDYLQSIPPIKITGIDLNSDAIIAAKNAIYSQRSISLLPPSLIKKNFSYDDYMYMLNEDLKSYVSFYHINICDKNALSKLGKFEVIFCRNMLIYFSDEQKKEALDNLDALLEGGGFLFLGHADISFELPKYIKIHTKYGDYFQKK